MSNFNAKYISTCIQRMVYEVTVDVVSTMLLTFFILILTFYRWYIILWNIIILLIVYEENLNVSIAVV